MNLKIIPRKRRNYDLVVSPQVEIDGIGGRCIKKSTRFTYKFPDTYFKLDYNSMFKEHTNNQIRCWEKFQNTEYKQYLCPILDCGIWNFDGDIFHWILQPQCKRKYIPYKEYETLLSKTDAMSIQDIRTEQMGYYDNRLVCFDYGMWEVY